MSLFDEDFHHAQPLVILVDDDHNILSALQRALRNINATLMTFTSAYEALEYCQSNQPQLVISDQHMPEMEGCEFLQRVKNKWPGSQRIILSGYQDFQKISGAFNSGIVQRFICKPWDNKELNFIVNKALTSDSETIQQSSTNEALLINSPINFHGIIAADETMFELFHSISQASTTNAPIFITGETGTGKELVAKACHQEGFHKDQPFVAVNCANFSENLMESQLFGHIKGAFTGASNAHDGLFASAGKGTLFLDEITTLSKPLQAKLLRVVQEREFSPLGSNKVVKFDAQIISASSLSIGQAVLDGEFRDDLYYRLNVISLSLPALRDRGNDLVLIAKYFLKKYSKIENKHFTQLSRDVIKIICDYDWPGNIRQLENIFHAMVVLNTGTQITSEMIIKSLSTTVASQPLVTTKKVSNKIQEATVPVEVTPMTEVLPLWKVEKLAIEAAIDFCAGNVPKAAALLEVSPSTIYRKKMSW
ncbi:sigma-54-dependent transcriptional regulator [Psychromonas sp. Urea-02u-13]|uniref:sigma-54-dependent transcriptional regulator n=1 Tax=Psychromonas sp. Urea-02u-13 TaxID=2058326 RepID=UPI000C31D5ED|nr:sigma-54 dependent transcriptional regulator [Psychromonas sp. Urea-02u-13]PKG37943.1 sigma-54-dependent Fis family transcriptional regulator [Psychromonas sp. Urea-02u-13]